MEKNYYFPPSSVNYTADEAREIIEKQKQKAYDFCTPWQTKDTVIENG